jgi:hypothetical protein
MKIYQYIFNGCDEEKKQTYYKMLHYCDDKLYGFLLLALFHQQLPKQQIELEKQIQIIISSLLSLPINLFKSYRHIIIIKIEKLLMNITFITTKLTLLVFLKQKFIINLSNNNNNNNEDYSDNVNNIIY